jgi:hypothetical protein
MEEKDQVIEDIQKRMGRKIQEKHLWENREEPRRHIKR